MLQTLRPAFVRLLVGMAATVALLAAPAASAHAEPAVCLDDNGDVIFCVHI